MIKNIQIVAFDNPNPPDYGGAVEIYYKLKALKDLGVQIDLHVFKYGNRKDFGALKKICKRVFIYKREMAFKNTISNLPFIVKTRENNTLLKNLAENTAPILFEGIHSCAYLNHPKLKDHFKIVRTHNIEHEYYFGLYKSSKNPLKKIYYKAEAKKLENFESVLKHADLILSLSKKDTIYFENYGKAIWIPPFSENFPALKKTEPYILFHANLKVEENISAVFKLIENVFCKLNLKVIIAGKAPDKSIVNEVFKYQNISLVSNPDKTEMDNLIKDARCHVFYTEQNTGVKLSLVHAIQASGHIVVNNEMLFDKHYKNELEVVEGWTTMRDRIEVCFYKKEAKDRTELRRLFDNKVNAECFLKEIE